MYMLEFLKYLSLNVFMKQVSPDSKNPVTVIADISRLPMGNTSESQHKSVSNIHWNDDVKALPE